MRAATGTKISSLLLLAPDGCHPTNNPQVDTVAKSWLGEQSASPLFLPKMPQIFCMLPPACGLIQPGAYPGLILAPGAGEPSTTFMRAGTQPQPELFQE